VRFEDAKELILHLLKSKGKATNREMIRAISGDAELSAEVRESLILDDLARDKDGAGLVYARPESLSDASAPPQLIETASAPAAVATLSPGSKHKVFMSYGRKDAAALASRLKADLEKHAYEIWQDTQKLIAGRVWEQEIRDSLAGSALVVALLTPHATRRSDVSRKPEDSDSVCLDEISYARFSQPPKPIVPVMAATCEPPFCIFRLEYVDLCTWQKSESQYQAGLKRLLEAIEAALRGEVRYRSWVQQMKPWDFGAFLNEKRQHFSGRQWLFEEIDAWRASDQERALLIVGDPGIGKSAVVAELVHRNPGGQVLAYHCCQADTPATLQPGLFVRSLAAMIASKLPAYAAALADPMVEDALSEGRCARDAASAFDAGILNPLAALPPPEEGVRYILVDALDEALMLGEGPGWTTIVDVLAFRLERLPAWLRLVATTRKERPVLDRLRGLRARELNAEDSRNMEDIDAFLALRLASPALKAKLAASRQPLDRARRALREKSAGNFLYLQQVLRGIERGIHDFERLDALPPGLCGLYLGFFLRHFPDEESFAPARKVLEVVTAAQEPLSEDQIARSTGLNGEEELPRVLRRLSAYLPVRDGRCAIFHKSLADWLTDPGTRGTLHHISRRRGHGRVAELCWAEYVQGPERMSQFALRHLPAHLIASEQRNRLAQVLCDLLFIQAKCAAGMTFDLVADYDAALESWPGHKGLDLFGPAADALPGWAPECAAVLAGEADPSPGKGAGLVLSRLGMLPDKERDPGPAEPRFSQSERLPEVYLGPDSVSGGVLEEMRRTESAAAADIDPYASGSLDGRVQNFAAFVSSHSHLLAATPRATIPLARNHAASGPVVERASILESKLAHPWLARDPRPPAPPTRPACVRTLAGHTGRVAGVALSADGGTAISAGADRTLRVWNVVSGACLRTLEGHDDKVAAVAMTPDGRLAISASEDRTLRVWDVATGPCRRVLRGHEDKVAAVALTPNEYVAISASEDRTLCVWDVATGDCVRRLLGHGERVTAVSITPDGKMAASGSADGTLRVWDVALGRCLQVLRGQTWLTAVALAPDGRTTVSGGLDGSIRLWDIPSGVCLRTIEAHVHCVTDVWLAPDGRLAVSASDDKTLCAWDLASGQLVRRLTGHVAGVTGVAVSGNFKLAVSASDDQTLRIWDLPSGTAPPSLHSRDLRSKKAAWLQGHARSVRRIAFTPDGTMAVSAAADRSLRIWDVNTGHGRKAIQAYSRHIFVFALASDGQTAVSPGWGPAGGKKDANITLHTWVAGSGRLLQTLSGHTRTVEAVALTADGRIAVSGSWDETARVWDVASGACLRVLGRRAEESRFTGRLRDSWRMRVPPAGASGAGLGPASPTKAPSETRNSNAVTGVTLTPDGRVAVATTWDKSFYAWDIASGRCLSFRAGGSGSPAPRRSVEEYAGVTLAPDGRTAVAATWEGKLDVWDVVTGKRLRTLEGNNKAVERVLLTPDGRRAVSAGWEKNLHVWDLTSGARIRTLAGHTNDINAVVLTRDGRTAISASDDRTLRVWDIDSDRCLAIHHVGARVTSLSEIRLDGRFACGTADGQLHFLWLRNVKQGAPTTTAVRLWRVGQHVPPAVAASEPPSGGSKLVLRGAQPPIRLPLPKSESLYGAGEPIPGDYVDFLTAVCPWCGARFQVPEPVLDAIAACTAHIAGGQPPCPVLQAKSWDDPRLVSECSRCGKPLRFNPFVVDNAGRPADPTTGATREQENDSG
jgi:WD40 repeat protein